MLPEPNARKCRRDRVELAPDFWRGIGLRIKRFQVAWPARAERKDDSPDRPSRSLFRHGLPAEHVCQAQPQPRHRRRAHPFATRKSRRAGWGQWALHDDSSSNVCATRGRQDVEKHGDHAQFFRQPVQPAAQSSEWIFPRRTVTTGLY